MITIMVVVVGEDFAASPVVLLYLAWKHVPYS